MIYCVLVHTYEQFDDNDQFDNVYTFTRISDARDCYKSYDGYVVNAYDSRLPDEPCGTVEFVPNDIVKCDDFNHVHETFNDIWGEIHPIDSRMYTP